MRNIHVIGPFNTGTNLMHNIIKGCDCIDLITNDKIHIGGLHEPFGKHTLVIDDIDNYLSNTNNILIIMYKDVYNWLYSIKKAAYDVKFTKMFLPVELYGKHFSNMIELYNFYYVNYMSFINKYPNVIFLDYEKVIKRETSYDYVNNKLENLNIKIASKPKFYLQLNTKAKSHGHSVKSADDANKVYKYNNQLVRSFINKFPTLASSVNPILLNFYTK